MHLGAMCTAFRDIGRRFELSQLNQGLWAMFSIGEFELQETLWNDTLPLAERLACLRSMRVPYLEFVAEHPAPVMENAFDMWWDMVLSSFWSQRGAPQITVDLSQTTGPFWIIIRDARRHPRQRRSSLSVVALHGLGHLHHPRVPERVTRFMQVTRMSWNRQMWPGSSSAGTGP